MGWESEYQESLAFKSDVAVTQALEMELQSASQPHSWSSISSNRFQEQHGSFGNDQDQELQPHGKDNDQHHNWDPVMTSLLKASNAVATSSPSSAGFHGVFAAGGAAGAAALMDGLEGGNSAGILVGSSSASSPPAVVLNAPGSAGAASTKVSKKRSRASRRPPTTVLEADSANFRSMVQHLTGIPAPPPMLPSFRSGRFDFFGGPGATAPSPGLVRPQPTRSSLGFGHHPSFATIDSSFHYQPPYSLRRLEDLPGYAAARGSSSTSSHGGFMDPATSAAAAGAIYSSMQAASGLINATTRTASSATTQLVEGVYVPHNANSITTSSSGLAMPSLWECEARDGERLNARIKGEAGVEEARRRSSSSSSSGRPIASWSTGNL